MDEERFNAELRKFLREVGVTSQQQVERLIRDGLVEGPVLRLRMTLTADNAPLRHVVERDVDLG